MLTLYNVCGCDCSSSPGSFILTTMRDLFHLGNEFKMGGKKKTSSNSSTMSGYDPLVLNL